ncbi:major facilitator superfamily domain-containing protein [Scheffersomyces xylosifermentans]|uniref:major facilitator superfamily domain-containing protein n=1 Tax=Scheffersomyces xylosifermentans TaxID=1304137 RepID=UPI00315DF30F
MESQKLSDQSQTLGRKKLLVTLSCLTASPFVSFFDQTAVSTAIPSISEDLHHAFLINSWTSTSYLIANTNFQSLYGRLSDIFGRKQVFLFTLLCCGLATSASMLFIFRGISGMGGGGVNSLRGKYFGIVAAAPSAGLLSEHASWIWAFWISCPICFLCALLPEEGSLVNKLKLIDWLGFVLFLVTLSGRGQLWPWKSTIFIVLITISIICFVIFILVERFYAEIPIIPVFLFLMCFPMGLAYFVDNYRGRHPLLAGAIQLPATCTSSIFGIVVGQINSRTGRYLSYSSESSIGFIVGTNIIQGCGIGFTFQPTLLALSANSDTSDRAVVTGLRNFFRCFGGSVGLVISGIVFNSLLKSNLEDIIPSNVISSVISNPAFMKGLVGNDKELVFDAYLKSYKMVLYILVSTLGITLLSSILIKDNKIPDVDSKVSTLSDEKSGITVKEEKEDSKSNDMIIFVEERATQKSVQ